MGYGFDILAPFKIHRHECSNVLFRKIHILFANIRGFTTGYRHIVDTNAFKCHPLRMPVCVCVLFFVLDSVFLSIFHLFLMLFCRFWQCILVMMRMQIFNEIYSVGINNTYLDVYECVTVSMYEKKSCHFHRLWRGCALKKANGTYFTWIYIANIMIETRFQ